MNKILPAILISPLLYGCGSSPIDIVKEDRMSFDNTYTVQQAFSNRDICADVNWSSFQDEKGRTIVEYRCRIKDSEDFLHHMTDLRISHLRSEREMELDGLKNSLVTLKTRMEVIKNKESKLISEVNSLKSTDINDYLYGNEIISDYVLECLKLNLIKKSRNVKDDCVLKIKDDAQVKISKEEEDYESIKKSIASFSVQDKAKEEKIKEKGHDFAEEIVQWAIIENKKPYPVFQYSGINYIKGDGEKDSIRVEYDRMLNEIYYGHSKSAKEYLSRMDYRVGMR